MGARRQKSSKSTKTSSARKKKMSFKNRALLISLSALVFIVVSCCVAYYASLNYLQSDSFRSDLEGQVANQSQADFVDIANKLKLQENKVIVPTINLGRRDMVQDVSLSGVEAQVNKDELYNRLLHIPKLYINKIKVDLDLNRMGKVLPAVRKSSSGFLSGFAPKDVRLDQVTCRNMSAYINLKQNSFALTSFKLQALPVTRGDMGAWVVDLSQGWIATPYDLVKKCRVESARVSVQPDGYTLDDCRILLSPGDIQLDAAYSSQSKAWTADIASNKANIGALLSESWKAKLHGELFANLQAQGDQAGLRSLTGMLRLKEAVVEALPFLSDYKKNNTYPYRKMGFDRVQCQLTYPYAQPDLQIADAWLFDEIDIEATGKLRVEGQVLIGNDRSLGGSLLVGIPTEVVEALTVGEQGTLGKIFNGGNKEGYSWLRINLSGTIDDPQQDLSIRITSMAKAMALKGADDAMDGVFSIFGIKKPTVGDDAKPEEKKGGLLPTTDSATDLLDRGSDAAKSVLESLF